MAKNLVSGLILDPLHQIWSPNFFLLILPLLDVRNCCKLSLYAISRKTNEPNLGNSKKLSFGPHFGPNSGHQIFFHKSGFANFFFKNLAPPVTRYYSQLSHVQYQKKLMIQSWENLVMDGQMEGRTDGRTDESDFIGHCPNNVEHPILKNKIQIKNEKYWSYFIIWLLICLVIKNLIQ